MSQAGAVLYLRVSSKEQVEGHSLESQLKRCQDYCERNGLRVIRTFREEGESAKTTNRTRLQEMLGYLSRHHKEIAAVVVKDFSRIARNVHDHHVLKAVLQEQGVQLHSVMEPVDESPFGRFVGTVFAGTHQLENELRAQRTVDCMQQALREGRWVWRAPLGYLWPPGDESGRVIEPDPETAPLVRRGFELVASGEMGQSAALREVSGAGLRTVKGNKVSTQSWSRMLRNPLYCGRIVYAKWDIDTDGQHEAIVSPSTWREVQLRLDGRRTEAATRGNRLDHPDFPLRRFVRCEHCGTPLTGEWAKGRTKSYAYYRCRKGGCRRVKGRKEEIEAAFVAYLADLQPSRAYLRLLQEIVRDIWEGERAEARSEVDRLQRKVEELRGKKDLLVEAWVFEARIDRETYDRLHKKITGDLAELQQALERARRDDLDIDGLLDYAIGVLTHADRLWRDLDPEHQRRFERSLFPGGVSLDENFAFRTAETPLLFKPLEVLDGQNKRMVAPAGSVSNRLLEWLGRVDDLRGSGIERWAA